MRIGLCFDRLVCDEAALARQLTDHEVVDLRDWRQRTPEALAEAIRACDVLITGKHSPTLLPALAEDSGRLRWICHTRGVVKAYFPRCLLERGIRLTNWGDAPARGVAQLAFSLLLTQILGLAARDRLTRGLPARLADVAYPTVLDGFRLGLFGCGGIGRAMARLAQGVGMVVQAYDPWADQLPPGVERCGDLDDLCRWSWGLSLHCGLGPTTTGALDARRLALLCQGAVVINTARGGIIDESALADAVARGRVVAACDVVADEKDWSASPLAAHPEVLLTGHGRFVATELISGTGWSLPGYALANLHAWTRGEPLVNEIDLDRYDRTT